MSETKEYKAHLLTSVSRGDSLNDNKLGGKLAMYGLRLGLKVSGLYSALHDKAKLIEYEKFFQEQPTETEALADSAPTSLDPNNPVATNPDAEVVLSLQASLWLRSMVELIDSLRKADIDQQSAEKIAKIILEGRIKILCFFDNAKNESFADYNFVGETIKRTFPYIVSQGGITKSFSKGHTSNAAALLFIAAEEKYASENSSFSFSIPESTTTFFKTLTSMEKSSELVKKVFELSDWQRTQRWNWLVTRLRALSNPHEFDKIKEKLGSIDPKCQDRQEVVFSAIELNQAGIIKIFPSDTIQRDHINSEWGNNLKALSLKEI